MTRYKATSEGMIPFTSEEELQWDAQESEWAAGGIGRKADQARLERDTLLAECDWIIVMSLEAGRAIPAEWATYRQALRDLPQQAGFPVTINWPVKP